MPHTLVGRLTYAIFSLISLVAVWKGSPSVRAGGIVLLVANLISEPIQDQVHWMDPNHRLLLLDLILLAFFLALAMRFGRAWMIFAAAFQLLSTMSHPAAHFARQIGPNAYLGLFQIFSYGVYLSLGAGLLAQGAIGKRDSGFGRAKATKD